MLKDFPVVVDIVVRWGDMDALGHVNNIRYLEYFEIARIEYLVCLGMDPPGPGWREYGLIVASNSCRYKAPVTYPDTILVGARSAALEENRVLMEYTALSKRLGKVVAEGDTVLVSYNYLAGRSIPFRSDLRDAILALEERELPKLIVNPQPARSRE